MKIHSAIILIVLSLSACGADFKTGNLTETTPGDKIIHEKDSIRYWFDRETSTVHKMICRSGEKRIVSIIKYHQGEPLEIMKVIKSVNLNGGLNWAYFVPSTKYIVELTVISMNDNQIMFEWKNMAADGVEKSGRDILVECDQSGMIQAGK